MSEQTARERIAGRLRLARERAGLSQGQAARLLAMHRPTISEIEAGNRRVLAEELEKFADLYDVGELWILGKVDEEDLVLKMAARGIDRLTDDDREKLISLLASLPGTPDESD